MTLKWNCLTGLYQILINFMGLNATIFNGGPAKVASVL